LSQKKEFCVVQYLKRDDGLHGGAAPVKYIEVNAELVLKETILL
jgi:hypothetical protein